VPAAHAPQDDSLAKETMSCHGSDNDPSKVIFPEHQKPRDRSAQEFWRSG